MPGLTGQQQAAVSTLDRNIIVSAGAGSGKTHVLVERYIELLRCKEDLTVSNIVAITYTRKAAAEMRTRLKAKMQQLMLENAGEERARWAKCCCEVDAARIVTIHSLCESLLRAYPTEAGIDPQFEVVDDVEQCDFINLSIDDAFRQVIEFNSPAVDLLMQQNIDEVRSWLQATLRGSIQFRESLATLGPAEADKLWLYAQTRLCEEQERALDRLTNNNEWLRNLSYVQDNPWSDKSGQLEQMRQAMISAAGSVIDCGIASGERWQHLVRLADLQFGRLGGTAAASLKAAMKQVQHPAQSCTEAIPAELTELDAQAFSSIEHLVNLFNTCHESYSGRKTAALKLDYNDLIELAVETLSKPNSSVLAHYTQNIKAVLVDEFQDTNAKQSTLVNLIASAHANLFLIGDDKQSIYKFQGADVATFKAWKQSFAEADPRSILSLSQSFRSHPSVVAFINAVFAEIMADPAAGKFDATFEELSAARNEEADAGRILVQLLPSYDEEGVKLRTDDLRVAESQAVANWILNCVESALPVNEKNGGTRAIRFGDFAVLVQQNKDFADIEKGLAAAGIPYVTLGGQGFLERQEIYDMQNLLSFLANPRDSHALVGLLRSSLFGITDDIIHTVGTSGYCDQTFWQKLKETAARTKDGFEILSAAEKALERWIDDAGRLPIDDLLRRIIQSTSYDVVLLSLANGRQRSRNLWKLVKLASDSDKLSCSEFAERLKLMREYKVKQADAPLDNGGSVKLMTIHSSKGLEFPAVALPILGKSALSRANNKFRYHRYYGLAVNTSRDGETKPSWYQLAHFFENEMEVSEKRRLYYVAMTRCRDYLSLYVPTQTHAGESFLNWTQRVLQIDPADEDAGSVRMIGTDSHEATYTVAPASASKRSSAAQPKGIEDHSQPVSFSLIEELEQSPLKTSLPWSGWTRVVPSISMDVHATVSGTYFHSLMEHLAADENPSVEQIESIAYAQGDVVAHPDVLRLFVAEGERLLQIYRRSKLYALLQSSKRHLHELPYTVLDQGNITARRPDLLIEQDDGTWLIVDYKTDKFDVATIEQQATKHRQQLKQYIDEFRWLTGITALPCIYFAEHGMLYGLPEQSIQLSLLQPISILS